MMDRALTSMSGAARHASLSRRVWLWAALAAIAVSWIVLGGFRGLYNPDEGRYAEIPREMLATGDWVIPHLNGLVYIEKPPLQYWATAVAYQLFGQSDWSARLYAALAGLATVLVTAWLARRLFGSAAAWRSGIVLGSSLLMLLMSHQLTLDMGLTLFMTLTLAAFCVAQLESTSPRARRGWMLAVWASAACAFLTKGLVAGALPVLTLIGYSALHRDLGPWRRLHPVSGIALFLAIVLPWLVLIQHRLPSFFDFFFVREHFERYLTLVERRYQPWWFFGEVLAAGSLPWIVPVVRAIVTGWRGSEPPGRFDARRLLWAWSVVVLVFFSASDSKLIPYILPMFPALAVLVGTSEERRLAADLRITAAGLIVLGAAVAIGAAVLPQLLHDPAKAPYFVRIRGPLALIAFAAVAGGAAVLWLGRPVRGRDASAGVSERAMPLVAALGAAGYVTFVGVLWAASALAPLYSGESLVRQLSPALRDTPVVYGVRLYDQSLPFYLRRTMTLVDYRGELDFGLTLDPHKGIDTLAAFEPRWRGGGQALAVMSPDTYRVLAADGQPMVVRARTPKELIVSRY
jgi:4-amino-4-deoxy-L-arabinose transferase-like glycosyltransferase